MIEATVNTVAVVFSAAFSGVMISVAVTLGGYWRSLPAAEFLDWFAENNQFVARSVPVTVGPALIGLVGSLWVDWGTSDAWLWALSMLCMVAVIVITGGYFVPANTAFASGQVEAPGVPDRLQQWLSVHMVRILLSSVASIIGCVAMQG